MYDISNRRLKLGIGLRNRNTFSVTTKVAVKRIVDPGTQTHTSHNLRSGTWRRPDWPVRCGMAFSLSGGLKSSWGVGTLICFWFYLKYDWIRYYLYSLMCFQIQPSVKVAWNWNRTLPRSNEIRLLFYFLERSDQMANVNVMWHAILQCKSKI